MARVIRFAQTARAVFPQAAFLCGSAKLQRPPAKLRKHHKSSTSVVGEMGIIQIVGVMCDQKPAQLPTRREYVLIVAPAQSQIACLEQVELGAPHKMYSPGFDVLVY